MDIKRLRKSRGLTQQQVSVAAGINQPELSAIENGRRPLTEAMEQRLIEAVRKTTRPSKVLNVHRADVLHILAAHGMRGARVFGSVLHGTDVPGSDVDLLVAIPTGTGLFAISRVERELENLLGVPVDLVPDDLDNEALAGARREAMPL